MIELIIIALIVFVIVTFVSERKNSKSNYKELQDTAKICKANREIIAMLKEMSASKLDKIACHLSVCSAGIPGVEVIQASFSFENSELASLYQDIKQTIASITENSAIPISTKLPALQSAVDSGRSRAGKAFATYFPTNPNSSLMNTFTDFGDRKTISISGNRISASSFISVGSLGVDSSTCKIFRSPYVLDAVAEAAKGIPNVSLTIDKTIPNKNN